MSPFVLSPSTPLGTGLSKYEWPHSYTLETMMHLSRNKGDLGRLCR